VRGRTDQVLVDTPAEALTGSFSPAKQPA